jgi:hypothetical protein
MSQNHRSAAPAIDPTKKSSLFEVPQSEYVGLGVALLLHHYARLAPSTPISWPAAVARLPPFTVHPEGSEFTAISADLGGGPWNAQR